MGPKAVGHVAKVTWSFRTDLKGDACPDSTMFKSKPISKIEKKIQYYLLLI